ncbi:MAG: PQQ-like beta-propeller repeat protein [Phycisphaerales bacterium]|nr:PQQ-like beta-propeller repeat protein [Phycisphaerales bacterium]
MKRLLPGCLFVFCGMFATAFAQSPQAHRAPWNGESPKVLWEASVATGFGGTIVHGESLFLHERRDEKESVRELNLADGKELWSYTYDAPGKQYSWFGSRTIPAVDDDNVYTLGPFGHVYAVNRKTHQPIWSLNLVGTYIDKTLYHGYSNHPLLIGDKLILAPMARRKAGLVALNKNTGEEIWKTPSFGSGESYVTPILLKLHGVEQIIMLNDKSLISFDPETGKTLWEYKNVSCIQPIAAPLVFDDGRIVVSSGANPTVYMLKADYKDNQWTITQLAHNENIGHQMHEIIRVGDHLYFVGNSNRRAKEGMVCTDLDLNVKWQTFDQPNLQHGDCKLIDGILYAMEGRRGILYAILPSPDRYIELAKAQVLVFKEGRPGNSEDSPMWAPMTVIGNKLIVRGQHRLRCLDISPPPVPLPALQSAR